MAAEILFVGSRHSTINLIMTKSGLRAPLSLYRAILKVHRLKLPAEMKELGDSYVRNEFKLHKGVTNSEHLDKFFYEWKQYLKAMDEAPVVDGSIGKDLEKEEINLLTAEQKAKLEELRMETLTSRHPQT